MSPGELLPFGDAFVYITTQVLAAWWANALASLGLIFLLRDRPPPRWLVLILGFCVAWLPLVAFYHMHAAFFAAMYPVLGPDAVVADAMTPAYALELIRYSTPFLPLWLAAVYGYEFLRGVRWFAVPESMHHDSNRVTYDAGPPSTGVALPREKPVAPIPRPPPFLIASRLPDGARVLALKADEHYVHVWTDCGTDLVRYRFRDAVAELTSWPGGQVHRSWWVNWDYVRAYRGRGRSLILLLDNDMEVPVSLAYKAEALSRLRGRQGRPA